MHAEGPATTRQHSGPAPAVGPDGSPAPLRVYLFNDTGNSRHAGCKAVMRSLRAELGEFAQIVATHRVGSLELDEQALHGCDAVVVNGEGSIHHDSPRAAFLLQALARAQAAGKRTALVNAVYQQFEPPPDDVLERLDYFSVREVRSAAAARQHGGCPRVLLDSAADHRQLRQAAPLRVLSGVVAGGTHPKADSAGWLDELDVPRLDLGTGTLDQIVAALRGAEVYVTGQHHGLYAAALAAIPFVALPSNSHKIEGLIEWSGLPIPVIRRAADVAGGVAFARRNRPLYREFADFVAAHDVVRAPALRAALTGG